MVKVKAQESARSIRPLAQRAMHLLEAAPHLDDGHQSNNYKTSDAFEEWVFRSPESFGVLELVLQIKTDRNG